jgi:hypothetical protein
MRNALVLIVLVALILPSCKKDDNGSKEPTQLVKIVTKQGSDSTVAEYTFDSQGDLYKKGLLKQLELAPM